MAYIYLIIKEYKAKKQKRAFKVKLRKYIRYLVKYIAFNIYKI